MTGAQKAAAIIALVVTAMAAFNWSLWRRLKAAQAERQGWSAADFDAHLVANGVPVAVAEVTRELVQPYYGSDIAPHPDDDFARFLAVDDEEIAELVEQGYVRLGLPLPDPARPVTLPRIKDVRDLAEFLAEHLRGQPLPVRPE